MNKICFPIFSLTFVQQISHVTGYCVQIDNGFGLLQRILFLIENLIARGQFETSTSVPLRSVQFFKPFVMIYVYVDQCILRTLDGLLYTHHTGQLACET